MKSTLHRTTKSRSKEKEVEMEANVQKKEVDCHIPLALNSSHKLSYHFSLTIWLLSMKIPNTHPKEVLRTHVLVSLS